MRTVLSFMLIGASATMVATANAANQLPRACMAASADGTGATEKIAKFQVYEGLLQSADMALWAEWVANGTLPGYAVKPVKYLCKQGAGRGVSCRGQTTICKR